MTLSAPGPDGQESGPYLGEYAGVLMFQDPDALAIDPGTGGPISNKFNGGATMNLSGALYFPSQGLDFLGNSDLADNCLQLVARTITFSGTTSIEGSTSSCADQGVGQLAANIVQLKE